MPSPKSKICTRNQLTKGNYLFDIEDIVDIVDMGLELAIFKLLGSV